MLDTIEFELVTPEKLMISMTASMVVIPGAEGDLGILPSHTPIISSIRTGVIDVHNESKIERKIFVSGGSVEMIDDHCTVLADEAIFLDDADQNSISQRLLAARKALEEVSTEDPSRPRFEKELFVAEALKDALESSSKSSS